MAGPLLRLEADNRVRMVLPRLAAQGETESESLAAAASLERGRVALLVRGNLESSRPGSDDAAWPADA